MGEEAQVNQPTPNQVTPKNINSFVKKNSSSKDNNKNLLSKKKEEEARIEEEGEVPISPLLFHPIQRF